MTLGDRLRALRNEKGLKQPQLARLAKVGQSTISDLENNKKGTSADSLARIASVLGTTSDYLLRGVGGLTQIQSQNGQSQIQGNVQRVNVRMLPVLSWVQAGNLTSAGPVEVTDIKEWYPALSDDDCDKCFYLEVKGISNYPDYQEGDFIQIDPTIYPDELVSGDIIVIHNHEGETFKKLIIENNGRKYLQALNPDWKPNIIEFDEETRLIGIVVDGFRPIGGSKRKRTRKH